MAKRGYTEAQLAYSANYEAALKRRRMSMAKAAPAPKVAYNPAARRSVVVYNKSDPKGVDVQIGTAVGALSSDTTGNTDIVLLNPVQQGAGSWNRVGKYISMHSIRISGILNFAGTPQATTNDRVGNMARLVLIYDKQGGNAATPNFNTIFGRTDGAGVETATALDPIRYDSMSRFVILKDKRITINSSNNPGTTGTVNTDGRLVPFDFYVKLKGLRTLFGTSSNPITSGDVTSGALYLVCRQAYAVTGNQISLDGICFSRLRYSD